MPAPEPLIDIVQVLPRRFWDEPALWPAPPFEGAELVISNATDEVIASLNPEVLPMLVFVHQVIDDAFGKADRTFVFRMHNTP